MTATTEHKDTPVQPPADGSSPSWRRRPIGPILAIWAVITTLLVIFGLTVPARLMGFAASGQMREIESTVTTFSVASAPVAGLVWAIALYSLIAWRHKGSEAPGETAPPLRGHSQVQIVWTVGSSVLCIFLLVWGLVIMAGSPSTAQAMATPTQVTVTGQQWVWNFSYPDSGNFETTDLYLEVNKPVTFNVSSKDVIHSFWIVEMGTKIDANPGETTQVSVTPDKTGDYTVRCAELCGLYHSYMETQVHVLSKADYDTWVATQQRQAAS